MKTFFAKFWISAGAAFIMNAALIASPVHFHGKVVCADKGVAGVAVTDGKTVVRTDAKGRYELQSDGNAEFLYISVPSGHEASGGTFYKEVSKVETKKMKADFELVATADDTKHLFFVWADAQVYVESEMRYIHEAAADMKQVVADAGNIPSVGVSCGDMIGEWDYKPSLFKPIADAVAESGVPFRYALGNHDIEMNVRSNDLCRKVFKSHFGPTYYSFDKGKVHYVVLDNVFFLARGYQYVGYLEEKQLKWLEQDLASVPAGSTLMVCMHIPTFSRAARRGEWSKEELNKITANRSHLYKMLEPYNTHLCTAHEHYAEHYFPAKNVMEHVHPPLSGLFWQSLWSMDGIPWGYMVYEMDGDNITWYYKPVGLSRDNQFSAYAVGEDPAKPDAVVANVWNYDAGWTVRWYEDGVLQGDMVRYSGYDRTICNDVEARRETEFRWKYIGAGETEHLFYAVPSSPDSKVSIEVTDRFGNIYRWNN